MELEFTHLYACFHQWVLMTCPSLQFSPLKTFWIPKIGRCRCSRFCQAGCPSKNFVFFSLNSPFQQKEVRDPSRRVSPSSAKIRSRIWADWSDVLVEGRMCVQREGCVHPVPPALLRAALAAAMGRLRCCWWWEPTGTRGGGLGDVRQEFRGNQASAVLLLRE